MGSRKCILKEKMQAISDRVRYNYSVSGNITTQCLSITTQYNYSVSTQCVSN